MTALTLNVRLRPSEVQRTPEAATAKVESRMTEMPLGITVDNRRRAGDWGHRHACPRTVAAKAGYWCSQSTRPLLPGTIG